MISESNLSNLSAEFMRPPEQVMRLDRMGSSHQTRLSFMRSLIRRMSKESWKFECLRRDIDSDEIGRASCRERV